MPGGVIVEPGLRSEVEDRWRLAYESAGSAALQALREADPELVAEDSGRLGAALRRVLDYLPEGGRALVVGHSPTNEAAILGLTGKIVAPLAKATARSSSPATTATRSSRSSKPVAGRRHVLSEPMSSKCATWNA